MNDFSLINFLLKYSNIGNGRDKGCSHLRIGQAEGSFPKEGVDEPKVHTQNYGWTERSSALKGWTERSFALKEWMN